MDDIECKKVFIYDIVLKIFQVIAVILLLLSSIFNNVHENLSDILRLIFIGLQFVVLCMLGFKKLILGRDE